MHQDRILMTMKSGLSGLFLLLLLSSTVSGLGSVVLKNYQYINIYYTWQDAQSYCSGTCINLKSFTSSEQDESNPMFSSTNYYTDLATIYTQSDAGSAYVKEYSAWIGLYKDSPGSPWLWTDERGGNHASWAENEPQAGDGCAFVNYDTQRIYGTDCGESFFFICEDYNYKYIFISLSKTWSDAQQYCKDQHHDLASPYSLNTAVIATDFPVWIGLHRDGETWMWGTGLSEYRNWASGEPGNNSDCVSISSMKTEMATQNCSARLPFVCFKDNLVLVKENKTWEEALEYCRALTSPHQYNIGHDLVSVQPGEDHTFVMSKVTQAITEKVWVGLRFLAGHWLWVNGANMLYSDLPVCPLEGQHCGSLSKNDNGSVETTDCLEKMNFLCYSTG